MIRSAVMGGADGLGIVLGLIAGLGVSHGGAHAIWAAALSGGIAEFFSMANAQRISDPEDGWQPAVVIGAASLAGCALPAVPYAVGGGQLALAASVVLCLAMGGAICWLRPEHGGRSVAETFVLLGITAVACVLAGLWV